MTSGLLSGPHGVLAHDGASTPCPLRRDAWGAAADSLEFAAALAVVADHAAGELGRARVRARLPSGDAEWIQDELGRAGEILALLDRGDRFEIPAVPDVSAVLARLRAEGGVPNPEDLARLNMALASARQVHAELRRVAEHAPRVSALAVGLVDRGVERRLEGTVSAEGELLDSASPALRAARRQVHVARERLIRKLETMLRGLDPESAPPDAAVTMRGGRYVIPVRRDSRARPPGIIHDESGSLSTLFIEPTAAIELGNHLRAATADQAREETKVLREVAEFLRPHVEVIAAGMEMCVAADDCAARARYAAAVGGCVPALGSARGPLVLHAARHPLLVASGRPVVPFDLVLDPAERTLLISGPNTGGKTVLLKAVGLIALMVQSGIVPPVGRESALPLFDRIYSDIGDHQSIAANLSTFSAHVATLREILSRAGDGSLVLLDEVGSGTDPAEGAALAGAALEELTTRGVLTLATTHLGALKTLAAHQPGIVNASLQFDAATLTPTYRFQKGVPGRSYGLAIARRLGVNETVLAQAETRVPEGERALDALLEAVESEERQLRTRLTALEDARLEAEREAARVARDRETVSAREGEVTRRERELEQRAKREAREYLLDARARVEEALKRAGTAVDVAAAREARRIVEEGIQRETPAAADNADPSESATGEPLAVGGRVRVLTGGTGEILDLRADGRAVVLVRGMRMVVPASALTMMRGAGKGTEKKPVSVASAPSAAEAPFEVDLRGMRADEAESATLAALDAAALAEHPHLRIIHGMGTGVLRDRVRRLLSADRRVESFDFAPRNQGGRGVTIVAFTG